MNLRRLLLLAVVVALVAGFFASGLQQHLSLDALKAQQQVLDQQVSDQPMLASALYVALYVLVTALSLPGAALLTLIGGALFGLGWGLLLVSFASTAGATLAMLISRFLLQDWVQQRFGSRLERINHGIDREGAFYLFALRLGPAFPFFLINLAMGLTRLPARTFWWVSQLGMLPGTLVYVNAGRELGQLDSLAGILSPGLLGAFVLLGLFPLIARRLLDVIKARRVYKGWQKPKQFDRNLVVIGAGSGGLVSAYIAAAVKADVSLIEKHAMGGDCLNTGCVPSKALIASSKAAYGQAHARRYGVADVTPQVDYAAAKDHVKGVIAQIAPVDSVGRFEGLGVRVIREFGRFVSESEVQAGEHLISARRIVIATGSSPLVPPIPGLDEVPHETNETLFDLRERPEHLLIIGGGPIGMEMAQAHRRLGSAVTVIEGAKALGKDDPETAAIVLDQLRAEGIEIVEGALASQISGGAGDTDGDLATIGNQDFLEHRHLVFITCH